MKYSALSASIMFLLIGMVSGCQSLPNSKQPIIENQTNLPAHQSDIFDTTLNNGLRVIIKPDKRTPIVMTQIWYKVGLNDEPVGKGGMSHFLEHLMFKDTPLLSGDDYHRLISHFGGDKNAFTSHDYTAYFESLPANQYPIALQIEANRMSNLLFDDNQIDTERQVIQEERRQRTDSNPIAKAYEDFLLLALPSSPKSKPIIGSMNDIDNTFTADLQNWYKTWYQPTNATLVMVGDIDVNQALPWIRRYFEPISSTHGVARKLPTHPSHQGYQQKTSRQAVQVPMLLMGFNVPSITTHAHDAYALSLFADIADGGLSARFEQNLVRQKQLFDNISVGYDLFERGDGLFLISATPKEGVSLAAAEEAILQELDNIANGTISDDELKRGQTNLVASLVFANDSIANQAQTLGMLASLDLPLDSLDKLPSVLSNFNKSDIQKAGQHYLVRDNLSSLYVIPND